jgi:DNA mismatch endonuclease (patch repair protein)
VFVAAKVAVFVDGCFWHGCPEHASWPKSNAAWWRTKIEKNQGRDVKTTQSLTEAGWLVIRIWEHEALRSAADRVEAAVRGQRGGSFNVASRHARTSPANQ